VRLHAGDNGKKQDKNRVKEVKESVYGERKKTRLGGEPPKLKLRLAQDRL
jgi:hypothetical protein